jgi:toxin secretion/phage lysis holin
MSWTQYNKTFFALLGIICGAVFGNMDSLMLALIIFVCIDYITGVLDAIYTKTLSSEIGFKGIIKKVIIFILVAVGNVIDVYVIKQGASIRTMVIFFYLANEGISILENVVKLDIPVPDKLYEILKHLDDK